ncbi:hypothetical protein DCC84_25345 [Pseudomonas sp. SXM-1]|nr:hypothetical protein DCC84_25345 [Pseudomonas sp. SXM-1]
MKRFGDQNVGAAVRRFDLLAKAVDQLTSVLTDTPHSRVSRIAAPTLSMAMGLALKGYFKAGSGGVHYSHRRVRYFLCRYACASWKPISCVLG